MGDHMSYEGALSLWLAYIWQTYKFHTANLRQGFPLDERLMRGLMDQF